MKSLVVGVLLLTGISCSESNLSQNFTGSEVSNSLFSGSDFGYEGRVLFREQTDGSTEITIEITGPKGESFFPAHLHFDPFTKPDAEVAALLSPVNATSGISVTHLEYLSNEKKITYQELVKFNGHIKIHLDDGANQDVILAYGNIGSNMDKLDGEMAPCNGLN